jgi:2-polyprenyl-6-methoxyphenol hydroxylase-like FAD-dependent oxidoreductase
MATVHLQDAQGRVREVQCKYVVAADGANSSLRAASGIRLEGQARMQTLINVHFTCKQLQHRLRAVPAMLYFVFNEHVICVIVAHDCAAGEYACQIPIFEPFQTHEVLSATPSPFD